MKKEYIVTLKNYDDLDSFYEEIETLGGSDTIPYRKVECTAKRGISRNTHYLLTDAEAAQLRKDPRVLSVVLTPEQLGIKFEGNASWTLSATFVKATSAAIIPESKNWGLYRCVLGKPVANWGTIWDGAGSLPVSPGLTRTQGKTITVPRSGENVDIVIVDSHINRNHPEFINPITNTSKVSAIDWFALKDMFGNKIANSSGSYNYNFLQDGTQREHGTHVAGIAAGETQGWAKDARILNIDFNYRGTVPPPGTSGTRALSSGEVYTDSFATLVLDYVKAFHYSKCTLSATPTNVNPTLSTYIFREGIHRPTVVNCSWGVSPTVVNLSEITELRVRNNKTNSDIITTLTGSTNQQKINVLQQNNIPVIFGDRVHIPIRYTPIDNDVIDLCDIPGLILVCSAGNSGANMALSSDAAFLDQISYRRQQGSVNWSYTEYIKQGQTPAAAGNAIAVGNLSTDYFSVLKKEWRAPSSNSGSRVDIWAPGTGIISSLTTTTPSTSTVTVINDWKPAVKYKTQDGLNYYIASGSGTSQAAPQVTGIVALYLDYNFSLGPNVKKGPKTTQGVVKNYLTRSAAGTGIIGEKDALFYSELNKPWTGKSIWTYDGSYAYVNLFGAQPKVLKLPKLKKSTVPRAGAAGGSVLAKTRNETIDFAPRPELGLGKVRNIMYPRTSVLYKRIYIPDQDLGL